MCGNYWKPFAFGCDERSAFVARSTEKKQMSETKRQQQAVDQPRGTRRSEQKPTDQPTTLEAAMIELARSRYGHEADASSARSSVFDAVSNSRKTTQRSRGTGPPRRLIVSNQWAGMERAAIPNTPASPAPLHWFVIVFWLAVWISVLAVVSWWIIAETANGLRPKYEDTFNQRNNTSVCRHCGKPIYYASGSEVWWEVHEPRRGYDRSHDHEPVGMESR